MYSKYKLEIKDSTIPGIGKGVFACEDIPAGEIITDYLGRFVNTKKEKTTEYENDRAIQPPMCLEMLEDLIKDEDKAIIYVGDPTVSYGPWINDCIVYKKYELEDYKEIFRNGWMFLKHKINDKQLDYNVKFEYLPDEEKKKLNIMIKSITDIKAGEELFVSYGYIYWFFRMYKNGWFD